MLRIFSQNTASYKSSTKLFKKAFKKQQISDVSEVGTPSFGYPVISEATSDIGGIVRGCRFRVRMTMWGDHEVVMSVASRTPELTLGGDLKLDLMSFLGCGGPRSSIMKLGSDSCSDLRRMW
jgi:hypothetical protein